MSKSRFWHYLKLTLEAIVLLNFSTICVFCFAYMFAPILPRVGFFQAMIWRLMFNEISSNYIIIALRILFFLSSLYLWFKKQNWLTTAYLIIAGTAAGILGIYFFAFYYLSIIGCAAVLLFCFCVSLILKFLAHIAKTPKINAFINAWKKFWTPAKIGFATIICILILAERFSPWEFPVFGKALPYRIMGYARSGRIPPYEFDVTIAVDLVKTKASSADLAATCAASARYFSENYGFPAIRIDVYDYVDEIQKMDRCFVPLAKCRFAPTGWHLFEQDKDLKPGWSHFEVARDIPVDTIRECNKVITEDDDLRDYETAITNKMGYWKYRQLTPSYIKVTYDMLSDELCEKPVRGAREWRFTINRKNLIEECESLFNELKEIGVKPNFSNCYKNGCKDKTYNAWVRRKYMLWLAREGNFVPEINAYSKTINAFANACAEKNEKEISALTAKMNQVMADLKAIKVCGNE